MQAFIKVTLASQDEDKSDGVAFIAIDKIISLTSDGVSNQVIISPDGGGFFVRETAAEILDNILERKNTFTI